MDAGKLNEPWNGRVSSIRTLYVRTGGNRSFNYVHQCSREKLQRMQRTSPIFASWLHMHRMMEIWEQINFCLPWPGASMENFKWTLFFLWIIVFGVKEEHRKSSRSLIRLQCLQQQFLDISVHWSNNEWNWMRVLPKNAPLSNLFSWNPFDRAHKGRRIQFKFTILIKLLSFFPISQLRFMHVMAKKPHENLIKIVYEYLHKFHCSLFSPLLHAHVNMRNFPSHISHFCTVGGMGLR